MKPNSRKNQKLIKQYPFVTDILSAQMEPYDGKNGTNVDDLNIRIQKADGDLMYRQANNIGLGGENSYSFQPNGNREGQIMRRGEYAFAVNKAGEIINRLDFPRNEEEERQMCFSEVYAKYIFWSSKQLNASVTNFMYSGCLWEETMYIVWVTVEAWHTDTQDDDAVGGRFGEFHDRSVHITIYGEPEVGFEKLYMEANVYKNLCLDARVMVRGTLDKDRNIICMSGMLNEMCITFQDEVYFNGMKDTLDNSEVRGVSGQFGTVKVLCAEMCGYDRVMLEDDASYITFQLRPDSTHLYVLGQQGTLPQIRNLVRTVVRMWREKPELRDAFKPDQNVSVM